MSVLRRAKSNTVYSTKLICLPHAFGEIWKTNRHRRIIYSLRHANSHTACLTANYVSIQTIELIGHPPYRPDLSPKASKTVFFRAKKMGPFVLCRNVMRYHEIKRRESESEKREREYSKYICMTSLYQINNV